MDEAPTSPKGGVSDVQAEVMEQVVRKVSIKKAKEMADATQQEYILAEQKARVQEDTVRKIHQKQADKAMVVSDAPSAQLLLISDVVTTPRDD